MITSHQIGQFKLLGKKKVKKVTKIGQEVLQHDPILCICNHIDIVTLSIECYYIIEYNISSSATTMVLEGLL